MFKSPKAVRGVRMEKERGNPALVGSASERRWLGRVGEGGSDRSGELTLDLQGAGCFERRKQGAWKSNGGKEQTHPFQA